MKKIISAVLAFSFIFLLAGCRSQNENAGNKQPKRIKAYYSEKNVYSDEEAQSVINSAKGINEAATFRRDFYSLEVLENSKMPQSINPFPSIKDYSVCKKYKNIEEIKKEAEKYYSTAVGVDNFWSYLEPVEDLYKEGGPYIAEVHNKLYVDAGRFSVENYRIYDTATIDVVYLKEKDDNSADIAIIKVDCHDSDEKEKIYQVTVKMTKENGVWVFDELV